MTVPVQPAWSRAENAIPEGGMRVITAYVDGFRFEIGLARMNAPVLGCDSQNYLMVCAINFARCLPIRIGSCLTPDFVSEWCNMTHAEAQAFVAALLRHCPELDLLPARGRKP